MKLKNEATIKTPEVIFELVVDLGEDGTRLIFSSKDEKVVKDKLSNFIANDYTGLDIDENTAKDVTGVSINQTIEASSNSVSVIPFGNTQQVFIEVYSAEVVQ